MWVHVGDQEEFYSGFSHEIQVRAAPPCGRRRNRSTEPQESQSWDLEFREGFSEEATEQAWGAHLRFPPAEVEKAAVLLASRALRWRRGGEEGGVHCGLVTPPDPAAAASELLGVAGEDPTWPGLGQEAQDMAESDHPFSTWLRVSIPPL